MHVFTTGFQVILYTHAISHFFFCNFDWVLLKNAWSIGGQTHRWRHKHASSSFYRTSAFNVEVRLLSNRLQKTSKCGKYISCILEYRLVCNCLRPCNILTSNIRSISEQSNGNMASIFFNLTFLAWRLGFYQMPSAMLFVDTGRKCFVEKGN